MTLPTASRAVVKGSRTGALRSTKERRLLSESVEDGVASGSVRALTAPSVALLGGTVQGIALPDTDRTSKTCPD
jgi:hypothetical protein